MIVTKTWLNEWIDLEDITTETLVKTLNSIGLEVDSVHTYKIPQKIVFGHVLECESHPDAQKLNVCKVDIGSEVLQIVCGASNVRVGLNVVVATLGAVMPEGLVIKPVVLRGVDSNGMICSASEIGLGKVSEGIIELDDSIGEYTLGTEVASHPLFCDDVIEIELTANRGDCLSIRGVARDLSAAYDKPIKEYNRVENDDKRGIGRILSISHDKDYDLSLRYKAVDLKNLKLPFILKLRLAQIGETIQSDLDAVMSYATHSSGVILRAYDYEFFASATKGMAKIVLNEDTNGYAYIKGEQKASIIGVNQEDTSKFLSKEGIVLIEASYIPPDLISKKMAEYKVPAGVMFYKTSRGSEPELEGGLLYSLDLLETNSESSIFGGTIEYENSSKEKTVIVSKQEIHDLIGAKIDKAVINKILTNLGFNISKSSMDNFVISIPQFRHDIINKQDIVEEIVRLVGIDNIPSKPFVFSEKNRLESDYFDYKKRTIFRHKAAQSGFFESVHFVFDEKKVLQEYGFETTLEELELLNPIVNTLDTLRPTLLNGLLKAASQNTKNGYSCVKLFEVGSVFSPTRTESLKMALLHSGDKERDVLGNAGKPKKIDFAVFVQKVTDVIGVFELQEHQTKHTLSHPYQCAKVIVGGEIIGELFRVHPEVEKSYDLDVTYVCELEFEKITHTLKVANKTSKYQASFRDLSVIMPQDMPYEKVKQAIELSVSNEIVRFYPVDKYSDATLGENMSLTLRFVLQSHEKTLEEVDITSSMSQILETLHTQLGIGLR
ncbi:MAG: phenylalanine--tRNA ligase subunit beta [Sulfurimonas sp. GWF2_37_8]|nr:MAG: phenylalanine--tRNA ligase subunit beta [Sulfurimonas sp. GWF2_37_8]